MTLPPAWIVDVDGTLALHCGRSPYDWRRARTDEPNRPVVVAVQALAAHPEVSAIIAISGREERAREITASWLAEFGVPCRELLMRADGDYRPDDVVKEEIFRQKIQHRYSVVGVIDDRDSVVQMWRRIGLVCFQVADGKF
jgi:hypothetical protein